jgi:hypothetical protein
MSLIRKTLLSLVFFIIFFLIIQNLNNILLGQETTPSNNTNDLISQGKIRTCLKAEFIGDRPHGDPPIQAAKYHLTGFCGSPSGCTCVWQQGVNWNIARVNGGECENFQKNYCKGLTKEEIKERRSKGDKDANKCVSCGHSNSDAINPILANLKPTMAPCNIIQDKTAKNNILLAKNQVLGASTILPYGPVDVVVEQNTAKHTDSSFYAVGDLPSNSNISTEKEAPVGDAKTQQLGKITFKKEDFDSKDIETKCTTISWDPYGRVFDAQSLEPISDVEVTLIDASTNNPVLQKFEDNFDITGNDGVFNILVEKEGYYKLDISNNLTNHQFISNPIVNSLWSKIYSDLYTKDKIFYEKPRIATHHDIPLVSSNGPYHGAIAVLIDYTLQSINLGENVVYTGRVSFPFAKVCLKNNYGAIIKCNNADNIGKFSISFPKNQLPKTPIEITATKVNLTDPNLYKNNNNVETLNVNSSITIDRPKKYYFEPILSYLEGYAYQENGMILPNADVLIILKQNDQIYYKTKADKNGFFAINTNDLPFFEYYLQFIDPLTGKKINQTTSRFISLNKNYLDEKNINLITTIKNNQDYVNKKNKINNISNKNYPTANQFSTNEKSNPLKTKILIVVFILILLILGFLGAFIYFKKQNQITS